jgi:hypothetical protein
MRTGKTMVSQSPVKGNHNGVLQFPKGNVPGFERNHVNIFEI